MPAVVGAALPHQGFHARVGNAATRPAVSARGIADVWRDPIGAASSGRSAATTRNVTLRCTSAPKPLAPNASRCIWCPTVPMQRNYSTPKVCDDETLVEVEAESDG